MILRRGKQPSAIDCFMHEKVAVVIARLAINAAILAMKNTGQKAKAPPAAKEISVINVHPLHMHAIQCSNCKQKDIELMTYLL